jgi:hypothetical protein
MYKLTKHFLKRELPRSFFYSFSIFFALLAAGTALAWTGPSAAPPGGNTPAPVNVGSSAQTKTGILQTGDFGATSVTVGGTANASSITAPQFCIGAACITSWAGTGGGQWITSGTNIYNANSGNVGIGTVSPGAKLDVINSSINSDTQIGEFGAPGSASGVGYVTVGSGFIGWDYGNAGLVVNAHSAGGGVGGLFIKRVDNGHSNVGIGTVSPDNKLDVEGGSITIGDRGDGCCAQLNLDENSQGVGAALWSLYAYKNGEFSIFQQYNASGGSGLGNWLNILNNGNVGIGTVSPGYKLDVNGAIATRADAGGTGLVEYARSGDNFAWGPLVLNNAGNGYMGGIAYGSGGVSIYDNGLTHGMTFSAGNLAVPGSVNAGGATLATNGDLYMPWKGQWLSTALNSIGAGGNITHWDTWYGSSYLGSNGDLYMGWKGQWLSTALSQVGGSPSYTYIRAAGFNATASCNYGDFAMAICASTGDAQCNGGGNSVTCMHFGP